MGGEDSWPRDHPMLLISGLCWVTSRLLILGSGQSSSLLLTATPLFCSFPTTQDDRRRGQGEGGEARGRQEESECVLRSDRRATTGHDAVA